MDKSNFFQIGLLVFLAFAGIVAVLIFGGFIPGFRTVTGGTGGTIVLWGTLPESSLQTFVGNLNRQYEKSFVLKYVAKNPTNYEADLVEAMASGQGPDLAILPQDLLIKHSNKIVPIPYSTITARTFQDTYFDGADILLTTAGITALPLMVDPLVMYYNKDLFSANNIAFPPANWSDFLRVQKTLTKQNDAGNLLQYGTALGDFFNIANTKEIVVALLMQSGNPIIKLGEKGLTVVLGENPNVQTMSSAKAATQFFTQFSDPTKATYSWNRSLPEAQESFLGGLLGTYFDFGSAITTINSKNPHLYYDISIIPQRDNNLSRLTYGRIMTVAVMASSKKQAYAASVAQILTNASSAKVFAEATSLAPARRDLLSAGASDPKKDVIYKSALASRAWLDPDPVKSRQIFNSMIESMTIGRVGAEGAVSSAAGELNTLISNSYAQ
ncbi:MAG: ABC transporter substrate-binding protein [Candidatus Paceibacterota bacterium]|jgi:ABC-type glycerol-3-phosphate transport system substrate-binding protein